MAARDEPIQTYYGSARIRLIVRLEDYGAPNTPAAAPKPTTLWRGITAKKAQQLNVMNQNDALILVAPGDDPSHVGSPQKQQTSSDGLTHVLDGIIPVHANWLQNGIRTADTLSLEVQFRDFPLDPRCVRSCAVQYFHGCVSAEDFERGLRGQMRPPVVGSAVQIPFNVVPDNYTDSSGRPRTNLRFEGWVDDWDVEFPDGEDSPVVRLECTDNTRLLLDEDAPPGLTVNAAQPLDMAIANYLANFPQFRGISIQYLPNIDRSKIPVLKQVLKATAFQPQLGPPKSGGGSKMKVWDYITDVCGSVGHICRFKGTSLVIQLPRTLYNSSLPARVDDPFTGRTLPSGKTLQRRLYLYGANVAQLKYKRKYGQFQPFNVEVRSYSIHQKKTIVARFPLKGDRVKRIQPGDTSEEKWIVHRVRGIEDLVTLRIIAQSIYEQLGRRELGVTAVTKNLGSYGGGNLDPDMLDAEPGDPVDIEVGGQVTINNTLVDVNEQLRSRPAQFLMDLGFSSAFSSAYAQAANAIGLPATYRIRTLATQWDSEQEATSIQADCINYVEVRADKQLPAGEEITASDVNAGSTAPITVVDANLGAGI